MCTRPRSRCSMVVEMDLRRPFWRDAKFLSDGQGDFESHPWRSCRLLPRKAAWSDTCSIHIVMRYITETAQCQEVIRSFLASRRRERMVSELESA